MASTQKATRSFKDKWEEDLKWPLITGLFTVPVGILTVAFIITVINLYVGWF